MRHVLLALLLALPATAHPKRVVLIMVDQLRADLPSRFAMRNVLSLQAEGLSFPNATVGHLASETVVSHPVVASGRLPRNLPWGDEVFRDPAGRLWLTTGLSLPQMRAAIARTPGPKGLPQLLREHLGGSVWAIGAKSYATHGMAAFGANRVITMSGPRADGRREPEGESVPAWLRTDRFRVDGTRTYRTEHLEYPMKGDQYLAGPDPARAGGDLWVADIATEVMRRDPDWRGLFLTMGGVDKVGHLLGEYHHPVDEGQDDRIHLAQATREADEAVGRVLAELSRRGLDQETLVVLTSDHGAQTGRLVGDRGPSRANYNWYAGRTENATYDKPSRAIAPVYHHPAVAFVMADTMLRVWLKNRTTTAAIDVAATLRTLPGVTSVHTLRNNRYIRLHRNSWPGQSEESRELEGRALETLAADHAPDLVALLTTGITYGTRGDHGGHQPEVQKIPLYVRGPGIPRGTGSEPARLADVVPTLLRALSLPISPGYDGTILDLTP